MKAKPVWGLILLSAIPSLAWAGPKPHAARSQATASSQSSGSGHASLARRNAGAAIESGTQISARLLTNLNARKAKPGQRVVARVTRSVKQDGRVVIRKNSRLLGHVVSARASSRGNAGSQIQVVFDHLVQGHSTTALNTVVTSVFSVPRPNASMPMGAPQAGPAPMGEAPAGGGGVLGGIGGAVGSAVGSTLGSTADATGSVASQAGAMGGSTMGAAGRMGAAAANAITVTNSLGATGAATAAGAASGGMSNSMAGISTNASGQSAATSTFSRRNGNLQMKSGTEMQFQVTGNAQARMPASR